MANPVSESPQPLAAWVTFITPFAETLGKDVNTVSEMLKPVVGEPSEQAIALLQDATLTPDADIKAVLNGTPSGVVNQAISKLRSTIAAPGVVMSSDILPDVPSDESWLAALKAGGTLKVDQATVISAVRASLGHRVGLYDIPDRLASALEAFAEENDEPVGDEFFKLRKQITQRNYGEIFEAIPGLDGNFISDKRRNLLFSRVDSLLWPALVSFTGVLKGWVDAWQQGAANPAMMMNAMMMLAGGGRGAMPPGMMAPPDSGSVRDQADAFADAVNKVFAGTAVPVARALAYDAKRIKETLENPALPGMIGAGSRDQMLRKLGVDVPATYPRLETNLTKLALGIMQLKDVPAGNDELQYLGSLYMLVTQIPWDQLGAKSASRSETRRYERDPGH